MSLSSLTPWVDDVTFSPLIEMTVSPTCRPAAFARNAAGLQVFSELIVTTGAGAPCNTMPHLVLAVGLLNVKGTGSLVCKGVAQWAWMCCGRGEAAFHTCLPDGGTAGRIRGPSEGASEVLRRPSVPKNCFTSCTVRSSQSGRFLFALRSRIASARSSSEMTKHSSARAVMSSAC